MSDIRHDHHFCDGCKERARQRRELIEENVRLERENVRLRQLVERHAPRKHDTACAMHVMHDDFYENPEPDEHPSYPRRCECGYDAAREALAVGAA